MAVRGPELELGITGGAQPHQIRVPLGYDIDRRDDLRMAAIEAFGQPEHRGQRADGAPQASLQHPVSVVHFLRRRLPMVAREERDDFDLLRIEAAQLSVLDQVVRVPVVALVADVNTGVV